MTTTDDARALEWIDNYLAKLARELDNMSKSDPTYEQERHYFLISQQHRNTIRAALQPRPDVVEVLRDKMIGKIRQRMGYFKGQAAHTDIAQAHRSGMMKAFDICEKILHETLQPYVKEEKETENEFKFKFE